MNKGKVTYVPAIVFGELENIKTRKNLKSKSEAFTAMVKYSKVGREAESILKLDFSDTRKGRRK